MQTAFFKHYSEVPKDVWPFKFFSPKEIACKGTGELLIDFYALGCLDFFRKLCESPVILNSAYRSEKHNKAVGGSPNSQHVQGKAFDVRITATLTREKIHRCAKAAGFMAFGDYAHFVHIDVRDKPAYWDYR